MIHPNALKLLLPKSNNQVSAKPITTVSITENLDYYVERSPVQLSDLESVLRVKFDGVPEEDRTLSLHTDESVPMGEAVKVLNIAKSNNYRLILATQAR